MPRNYFDALGDVDYERVERLMGKLTGPDVDGVHVDVIEAAVRAALMAGWNWDAIEERTDEEAIQTFWDAIGALKREGM